MTDEDHTDDVVFLTNTPAQIESQLHNLRQKARRIAFYMNENKKEFLFFFNKSFVCTQSNSQQFDLTQVLTFWARVNLEVMAGKEYSTFSKTLGLKHHH